jgi:aminoglycoside phosphotransferase (APT) family kinase protein
MSTIGHPLSDLVNLCTPYFLKGQTHMRNLPQFEDGATPGLPNENELIKWYAEVAGWDPSPEMRWGVAFGFFRATCIYQGIAARYAVRQASSAKAKDNAAMRHPMAALAWDHVQKAQATLKDKAKL